AEVSVDCQRILGVRVAVEFGVQASYRFNLGGQGLVTQKSALMRERNPELPNVAQRLAIYRVNRDPQRPLAVCRLLPWIHLSHGALLLRGKPDRLSRIFSALSSLRTGFSPQPTVRSLRLIDLLCVPSRSRQLPFAQRRHQ